MQIINLTQYSIGVWKYCVKVLVLRVDFTTYSPKLAIVKYPHAEEVWTPETKNRLKKLQILCTVKPKVSSSRSCKRTTRIR